MTKDEGHLKLVNNWIQDHFPLFRLNWAPDEYEHRYGTFVTNYPIYSSVTEIRKVPKYPFLTSPCYILETRASFQGTEIKDHNGWEVVFPFVDQNGDAVFPDLESVQFMLKEMIPHDKKQRTTSVVAEEADRKKFDQEVETIEGKLEA